MKRITHFLPALALYVLAGAGLGTTVPARAAAPEPVAVDAAFKPAEQAAQVLKQLGDDKFFKGVKRVAVTQFAVQFITADSVSAETAGGLGSNRASVSASYKLGGVGEPEFQAATEAFHAEFLRAVQAGGLEVVPLAQVQASPVWKRLAATGQALPARTDDSVTVSLPGLALYGVARAVLAPGMAPSGGGGGGGGLGGLLGAVSAIGSVAQAVGQGGELIELEKELGATLVEVTLRVHFAQLTNNNRGFLGRMSNTASVSAKLAPAITLARLTVSQGGAAAGFDLVRPLLLDAAAVPEVRKPERSTGETAAAIGLGLLRAAVGSRDSTGSERYEAVADPAKWREVVGQGMALTGEMFVQRLNAVR